MADSRNSCEQICRCGRSEVPTVDCSKKRMGVCERHQLWTPRSSGDQVMRLVPNPINPWPAFAECNRLKIVWTFLSHPECWGRKIRFGPTSGEGEVEFGIAPLDRFTTFFAGVVHKKQGTVFCMRKLKRRFEILPDCVFELLGFLIRIHLKQDREIYSETFTINRYLLPQLSDESCIRKVTANLGKEI